MEDITVSRGKQNFTQDLSDAYSAMHCLENNISVPKHLLAKFGLDQTDGLESDEDKRGWFSKIIDRIKSGWKLEIGESGNQVAICCDGLDDILSSLKKRTRASENNNDKFTPDKFGKDLRLNNIPQVLIFLGKEIEPKSIMQLVESGLKLDIKPIKLFNVLKVDYENRKIDSKGLVEITKDAKNKVIKEAKAITNSDFLDSETIRKSYKKYAKNLNARGFLVADNLSTDNKDYELFIPLIASNTEVASFIRDTRDFFAFMNYNPIALEANTLNEIAANAKPWTYNEFNDFTVELIKLITEMIRKIKDSFVGLKGLTAEKIIADLQDAENREIFANVQYVLTTGYRDLLIVAYNMCASLSRFQNELYLLTNKK